MFYTAIERNFLNIGLSNSFDVYNTHCNLYTRKLFEILFRQINAFRSYKAQHNEFNQQYVLYTVDVVYR